MRNKVKRYINSCIECAYHKRPSGRPEGELHSIDKIPIPFHTVHVDHLGPFPKSSSGKTHILGIVDGFTKYVILHAVKSAAATPVLRAFTNVISCFGSPVRVITDRGTAFTSKEFKGFCDDNGISHIMTAARTPRANGQIERCNRTILSALSTTSHDPTSWDKRLRAIQWGINSSKNEATKRTPHELLFGFQPRDPLSNKILLALHDETTFPLEIDIDQLRENAYENITANQRKQKERYDGKHKRPRIYKEGDLVLIERPSISTGESRKLDPKYKGPYIVAKALDKDRYIITDIPNAQRTQRRFESVYSADNMKPWCSPPDVDLTDSEDFEEIEDDSSSQDGRAVVKELSRSIAANAPVRHLTSLNKTILQADILK